MMGGLHVYREFRGESQLVGTLALSGGQFYFAYDGRYLASPQAAAISLSLPLRDAPFSEKATHAFFESLLPEGEMGMLFRSSLHLEAGEYPQLLSRLNNESIGALVFRTDETLTDAERAYEPLPYAALRAFALHPKRKALDFGMASRLSLAGAQTKAGLYHRSEKAGGGWFLPCGSAPSTHIVKASDGTFPCQTVNEALCLLTARRCGFDTANFQLVPMPEGEPLLAVERFDRIVPEHAETVSGIEAPVRLHQEDFCQAAGLSPHLKYEPTDGNYLSLASRIITRASANPFGDRMMLFNSVLFDFLIGNCDNHLKNRSLLWDADWSSCSLSPLYDITCTTRYPALERTMGVALCESRTIDKVAAADIRASAQRTGISERMGWEQYLELREAFPSALDQASEELAAQGFTEAREIAAFIREDAAPRLSL